MADGLTDDAVDGGVRTDAAEAELVEQALNVNLPRGHIVTGVSPTRPKPACQHPCCDPGVAHGDPDHRHAGVLADRAQRQAVLQAMRRDGHLHDLGAARQHGLRLVVQVSRGAPEIVVGQDDSSPAGLRDQVGAATLPLDIHVLGSEREGFSENAPPLLFAALEHAALGRWTAGDDHRLLAARECGCRAWVAYRIQPQLHQVDIAHQVALRTQVGHGVGRHGCAEFCGLHLNSPNKKAPLPIWAKRRFGRALH